MNWVDLLIISLLIFFVFEGYGRSFLGELLDFFSFLLALIFSLRFYNLASNFYQTNFQVPHSLSNVIGFMTIWFLTETVLFLLVHVVLSRNEKIVKLERYLSPFSLIPSFLRGLVFVAILLLAIGTFPIQPKLKLAVEQSKIGFYILDRTHGLEGPFKNVFGGVTEDTLTFLTIKPRSNESVNLGFRTTEFKPNPGLEREMIKMVNSERAKLHLKPLEYSASLMLAGRAHSGDMFSRGYFSHYSPEGKTVADRADEAKISYLVVGENLAYAPNLRLAHSGLMNSTGHRANILSREYKKIGIGIMDGGVYGLMITQVFSN